MQKKSKGIYRDKVTIFGALFLLKSAKPTFISRQKLKTIKVEYLAIIQFMRVMHGVHNLPYTNKHGKNQ